MNRIHRHEWKRNKHTNSFIATTSVISFSQGSAYCKSLWVTEIATLKVESWYDTNLIGCEQLQMGKCWLRAKKSGCLQQQRVACGSSLFSMKARTSHQLKSGCSSRSCLARPDSCFASTPLFFSFSSDFDIWHPILYSWTLPVYSIYGGDKNLVKPNTRRGNFVQYKLDVVWKFGPSFYLNLASRAKF